MAPARLQASLEPGGETELVKQLSTAGQLRNGGTTKGGVEKEEPVVLVPRRELRMLRPQDAKPPLREQRRRERPAQLGPQHQHVVDVARRCGAIGGRGGSVGTVRSAP